MANQIYGRFLQVKYISRCYKKYKATRAFSTEILNGKIVKIGCASGFWGDTTVAAPQLIYGEKVDYIVFDYLSEITMSLMAAAKEKNPAMGYAPDFISSSLAPFIADIKNKGIKVVSNAGGVNPTGCQQALQKVCQEAGVNLNIAVIKGDNLMSQASAIRNQGITEMSSGCRFPHDVHSMNAYFGARPIMRALNLGADIVITGRCVDSALVLGPLLHEFAWSPDDHDLLAAGSLAGHLIECGAQVTGGIFTDWHTVPNWDNIGFPIVHCASDGKFIVTKPPDTGGLVSPATVGEQLLYEVGDPAAYCLPDVVCDFSDVRLQQLSDSAVLVTGPRGTAPSGDYKVSATHLSGYRCTAVATVGGGRASEKAKRTAAAILGRCRRIYRRLDLDDFTAVNVEAIGTEHMFGPNAMTTSAWPLAGRHMDPREVMLWLAVTHNQSKALDVFAREIASAGTGMAPGLCSIVGGRPKVSPVLRLFSFLYPIHHVEVTVEMNGEIVEKYTPHLIPTIHDSRRTSRPASTVEHADPLLSGDFRFRLEDLAFTRSGDKGDDSNIGVIARHPSYLPYLRHCLTPEAMEAYFSHLFDSSNGCNVERFDVPGISAMNFILRKSLGGGGVASLRSDPQEIDLALILKSHGNSATQILKNWIVDFPMAPDDSTATGWNLKRRPNSAYLAIFLTSAASTTDPAASAARIRFEDASMLTHVASPKRQRPRE